MSCRQFEEHWEEWLRGTPPPELTRHLEACAACRRQAEELKQSSAWLAALRVETPPPGPAFWARLRERLEAPGAAADFWEGLSWAAARAAWALAVLVLLLGLGVLLEPAPTAEFDQPLGYLEESSGVAVANGQLDRDQVVLTLVAYQEPQR